MLNHERNRRRYAPDSQEGSIDLAREHLGRAKSDNHPVSRQEKISISQKSPCPKNRVRRFLKDAFREEKSTMLNHAVSAAGAVIATTAFAARFGAHLSSDALAAALVPLAYLVYYGLLVPQFLWRDRIEISKKSVRAKLKEYFGTVGAAEAGYAIMRFLLQRQLQYWHVVPATASLVTEVSLSMYMLFALPLSRFTVRSFMRKNVEDRPDDNRHSVSHKKD